MFSTYTIAVMYATGVIEVMLPVVAIYAIYFYKPFKISSLICGLACYFIVDSLIISNIYTIVIAIANDTYFFEDHIVLSLIIECGLTAALVSPIEYWILLKVRHGKMMLSDAMVMGAGYTMVPFLTNGALYISNARICQYANQDRLSELANETYTEDVLDSLVESVQASFATSTAFSQIAEMAAVIIAQIVILLVAVSLAMLLFFAVKRRKKYLLAVSCGIDLVFQLIRYGSSYVLGYWPSFVVVLLVGAGAVCFIIRFLRYYRMQQIELLKKQKDFEERRHQKHMEEMEAKKKSKEQNSRPHNQQDEEKK